jgi:hypothetical protein
LFGTKNYQCTYLYKQIESNIDKFTLRFREEGQTFLTFMVTNALMGLYKVYLTLSQTHSPSIYLYNNKTAIKLFITQKLLDLFIQHFGHWVCEGNHPI